MIIFIIKTLSKNLIRKLLIFFLLLSCSFENVKNDVDKLQEGSSSFASSWVNQIAKAIPQNQYGVLVPLLDPAHSRFPYWYLNEDQYFNQLTYNYVSARVMPGPLPGTVQLSGANGFTDAYTELMSGIDYYLSTEDKEWLRRMVKVMGEQANRLVETYENIAGPVTAEEIRMANAELDTFQLQVDTPLDYIVTYIMGYIWSDHEKYNQEPLTFKEMVNARNLGGLFPLMPASGSILIPAFTLYLESYRSVRTMGNALQYNSSVLNHALNNTLFPADSNGGVETFDPLDGDILGFQPAYEIELSLAEIRNALNDLSRVIKLTFSINQSPYTVFKDSTKSEDEVMIFTDSSGCSIDLGKPLGGVKLSMSITYYGYIYVPFHPKTFSSGNGMNWYYASPVYQAANSFHRDKSGYHFCVAPAYNLGGLEEGGNYGMITGALIANPPEVTIILEDSDTSQYRTSLNELSREGRLQIPAAQINGNYSYGFKYEQEALSVVFRPIKVDGEYDKVIPHGGVSRHISVPIAQQLANVLMVSVFYPGSAP